MSSSEKVEVGYIHGDVENGETQHGSIPEFSREQREMEKR